MGIISSHTGDILRRLFFQSTVMSVLYILRTYSIHVYIKGQGKLGCCCTYHRLDARAPFYIREGNVTTLCGKRLPTSVDLKN